MSRFKTYLLIFMMLWLPLKGVLAIAMPICPMDAQAAQGCDMQMGQAAGHEHCQMHEAPGAHGSTLPHLGCDHCMNCSLLGAPFLTVPPIYVADPQPATFTQTGTTSFFSYIGDLFDRPPLSRFL